MHIKRFNYKANVCSINDVIYTAKPNYPKNGVYFINQLKNKVLHSEDEILAKC